MNIFFQKSICAGAETYLEQYQTPVMERFCENN